MKGEYYNLEPMEIFVLWCDTNQGLTNERICYNLKPMKICLTWRVTNQDLMTGDVII